jgi:hypothetical protein
MDFKSPDFNFRAELDLVLMYQAELVERPTFKPQDQNFWPAQTNIERHRKLVYRK